jgi:hypothetical protein
VDAGELHLCVGHRPPLERRLRVASRSWRLCARGRVQHEHRLGVLRSRDRRICAFDENAGWSTGVSDPARRPLRCRWCAQFSASEPPLRHSCGRADQETKLLSRGDSRRLVWESGQPGAHIRFGSRAFDWLASELCLTSARRARRLPHSRRVRCPFHANRRAFTQLCTLQRIRSNGNRRHRPRLARIDETTLSAHLVVAPSTSRRIASASSRASIMTW